MQSLTIGSELGMRSTSLGVPPAIILAAHPLIRLAHRTDTLWCANSNDPDASRMDCVCRNVMTLGATNACDTQTSTAPKAMPRAKRCAPRGNMFAISGVFFVGCLSYFTGSGEDRPRTPGSLFRLESRAHYLDMPCPQVNSLHTLT